MFDWIPQGLDFITTRVLDVSFTLSNMIVLGVSFVFGFYFGKLTKNVKFWKILILFLIGGQVMVILANSHSAIVYFFIFGILTNHAPRLYGVFSWVYDLKDLLFALRYRRAFEDIRRKEEELEAREKSFQEEQARFYKQSQQNQERRSQEQTKSQDRQKQGHKKAQADNRQRAKSSSNRAGTGQGKQEKRTQKPPTSGGDMNAYYLKVLGLEAGKTYSKDDLKKAFRKQARKAHPDGGGSHEAFLELVKAYEGVKG